MCSGTCCATNTVHVSFFIFRALVINYMCNSININSTCRNICCNKNIGFACFEITQSFFTCTLTKISMDWRGFKASFN